MCFSILVLYISQNFLTFLISFLNTFPAANELTEKLAIYYIALDNISINQISSGGMYYKEYPSFFQEFETVISASISNFSNSGGLFNICQNGNTLILMSDTEVTISSVIIKVIGKKH